jgi:Fe2+ transport system protein FeoA
MLAHTRWVAGRRRSEHLTGHALPVRVRGGPELCHQPVAPRPGIPLDLLNADVDSVVLRVGAAHASELAAEGLWPGRIVRVTGRAPFGGPVLVLIGRARLAISRSVAADVLVEPRGASPDLSTAESVEESRA